MKATTQIFAPPLKLRRHAVALLNMTKSYTPCHSERSEESYIEIKTVI